MLVARNHLSQIMKNQKTAKWKRKETLAGYLFILPTIVLYSLFYLLPIGGSFALSFTWYDIISSPEFVGIQNYIDILDDSRAWHALRNTFVFTFFAVLGNVGMGLFCAVLIQNNIPHLLKAALRFSFFFPVIIAPAIVSIVWKYFYDVDTGLFNYYLGLWGIEKVGWLSDQSIALYSILVMDVWKNLGFSMIVFLAALQDIPKMYYDAAMIDGASRWQMFLKITLPLLSRAIFVNTTIVTIGALQVFDSIQVLTKGGPGDSTRSIVIYIYEKAFNEFELGYSSAVAMLLLVLVMTATFIQIKLKQRWSYQ